MITSHFIYETTIKELSDFENLYKYISHYQVSFDKIPSLLTETSSYTQKNAEIYFQATILMNIRTDYLAFVSVIQKN